MATPVSQVQVFRDILVTVVAVCRVTAVSADYQAIQVTQAFPGKAATLVSVVPIQVHQAIQVLVA